MIMKTTELINKYAYRVNWSEEDKLYISSCVEFPSLFAHGRTMEAALKQIRIVVKETVEWLKEENEKVPQPFSLKTYKGNLTLRVPSDTHRQLAIKSAEQGVSINQYILSKL